MDTEYAFHNSEYGSVVMRSIKVILVVLLMSGATGATIVNLSSLPYTAVSGDTIRFNGTKLQASTSGITIPNSVDSVWIDGQGDTLEFATQADVDNATGIIFGTGLTTGPKKIDVTNLVILLDQNAADTAHNSCIGVLAGGWNVRFNNVRTVMGSGVNTQSYSVSNSIVNWTLTNCSMYDTMGLNTDRHSTSIATVGASSNPVNAMGATSGGVTAQYHFRAINSTIYNTHTKGYSLRGAAFLYGCKIYVNTYNPLLPSQEGNSFAVMLRVTVPSNNGTLYPVGMRACTLLTTPDFKGGRGLHITQVNCTPTNPCYVDSNYISMSLGPNGESQASFAVEIEVDATTATNKNIYMKRNTFITTGDDNAATAYIGNDPQTIQLIPTDGDTNIFCDSNTIYTVCNGTMSSAGTIASVNWQFVSSTAPAPAPTVYDSTITFRWNTVNTGIAAFSNSRGVVEGNTIRRVSADSCATSPSAVLGAVDYQSTATSDTGAWYIDQTYVNMADTAIRHSSATTGVNNSYIARRAAITVVDSYNQPVSGATVTVVDKNLYQWFTGTTDGSGIVRALSPYFKKAQNGTSITAEVLNPYTVTASKSGYTTNDDPVSWSTSVGSYTIIIAGGTPPAGTVKSFKGVSVKGTRVGGF